MSLKEKENVIPFGARSSHQKGVGSAKKQTSHTETPAPIIDISNLRAETINQERRKVRRTILNEFIGVHAVVPNHGLMPITLHDVSSDGLSFDIAAKAGQFRVGEELAMRIYLNHDTYFPFFVQVDNVRYKSDETVQRHGAHFVKGSANIDAFQYFIRFLESVSTGLQKDNGDIVVTKLIGYR
ncbi:MAG: PilZ domain-containing protein [Bdellovibrionales bacterium]|nr:PilZ domain-containing protein [Bdellovibrionales bacterium]